MVNYRRNKIDCTEAVYFITIVTQDRDKRFLQREDYLVLWQKMVKQSECRGVIFDAWVLQPEHMHCLLRPRGEDYSKVVFSFKRAVSAWFKEQGRICKGEKFWQDRFWEHTVRDEDDYWRCVDYIHYNPVKHGHTKSPIEWKYSSLRKFVEKGFYPDGYDDLKIEEIVGAEWD